MKVLNNPITVVLLFLALGIVADNAFHFTYTVVLSATVATAVAFLISYVKAQKKILQTPHFFIATCLFSFSTGILSHWLHYDLNNENHYTNYITAGEVPAIKGVVSERLKPNQYYEKYYFEVKSVNKTSASGKILLSVPRDSVHKNVRTGDVLVIVDSPQTINKALNPYQFNYASYMQKQNVFGQLKLRGNYIMAGREKNFDFHINQLRYALINSFSIHNFPPEIKNIINALLFGQRQDMDKETTDNYTKAGVVHILAISGLHFATLFFILTFLFNPLKRFRKRGMLLQLLLILVLLWTFAFITGLSASVVRSVVMFSFVGIGRYFNRNSNIFNSVAVSMLVLLIAKPTFLFDVGFQLSYAAVFAIVWLHPLYSRIKKSKYNAVNYVYDTVVISLVAQIGVLPLTLYYFNQFPLLFLLANIIVIPLSTVILLLGIAILILNFTVPTLAVLAGKVLEALITMMNHFIKWIASFDNLVLKDIPFSLLLCTSLSVALILIVRWLYLKNYSRTVAMLASIILFQALYFVTEYNSRTSNELIVFNNRKNALLATLQPNLLSVYSNDSLATQNTIIRSYRKELFNPEVQLFPIKNTLWFYNRKILIIDSTAVYPANAKPDVILLTGSPKVNVERMLLELKPKEVIVDATNYKKYIALCKITCDKLHIPFHATPEKGYFRLKQ